MSLLRLALRSLIFHWRSNLAVALGVMAATAVLTGALVVGDSVGGSLRQLAVERLGRVDAALVTPHFFHKELAAEVAADPNFKKSAEYTAALPAIMLQGTLENPAGQHKFAPAMWRCSALGQSFGNWEKAARQNRPAVMTLSSISRWLNNCERKSATRLFCD